MKTDYHIEPDGGEFILVDAAGETVGVYPSQDAAKQDIARCEQEDAMYEAAKQLVDLSRRTCRCSELTARRRATGFAAQQRRWIEKP